MFTTFGMYADWIIWSFPKNYTKCTQVLNEDVPPFSGNDTTLALAQVFFVVVLFFF